MHFWQLGGLERVCVKKCSLVHLGTNYCCLVRFGTVKCMLLHGRYVIGAFRFVYVTVKESFIVSQIVMSSRS